MVANDTPHSANQRQNDAMRRLTVAPPPRQPKPKVDHKALIAERLRADPREFLLMRNSRSWTWGSNGGKVPAGAVKTMIKLNELVAANDCLFPAQPGKPARSQTWRLA